MGITIGSAPDSWGVWFADDPLQTPASRFLDEVAEAGYEWIELGPYGYLPTDAAELSDELAKRDLKVSAGTIFAALHRPDHYDEAWAQVELVADLTRAVGGTHLVVIPGQWRSDKTGEALEPRELDEAGWQRLASGMDRLGADVKERYGLQMAFHSHADTHVDTQDQIERFLEMTDPEVVKLCLDTGHVSFSGGGQPGDHPQAPRPDRLRPPQAGRPAGGRQGQGRGPRLRRRGEARRHGRAPAGGTGHAAGAGRPGRSGA